MISFVLNRFRKSNRAISEGGIHPMKRKLIFKCMETYNQFANELIQLNSEACKKAESHLDYIMSQTKNNDPKDQNIKVLIEICTEIDKLIQFIESEIQSETEILNKRLDQFSTLIKKTNLSYLEPYRIEQDKAIESFRNFCAEHQAIAIHEILNGYGDMAKAHQHFLRFFMQSPLPGPSQAKEYATRKKAIFKATNKMDQVSKKARKFFSKVDKDQIRFAGQLIG